MYPGDRLLLKRGCKDRALNIACGRLRLSFRLRPVRSGFRHGLWQGLDDAVARSFGLLGHGLLRWRPLHKRRRRGKSQIDAGFEQFHARAERGNFASSLPQCQQGLSVPFGQVAELGQELPERGSFGSGL